MKFAITSFSTSTNPSVSADSFCFVYNYNSGYSGTDAATKVTTQTRMRISNLFASVSVAAGTSASWTITLRKNGADTALATTISGASQVENTNSSDVITFEPGDTINLRITPSSGTNPATSTLIFTMLGETMGGSYQPMWCGVTGTVSAERWSNPMGGAGSTSHAAVNMTMPTSGIFTRLNTRFGTAPGTGTSWSITLCKNGTDTSLTTTVANTATYGEDLTNQVRVAAGDTISLHYLPTGSVTASSLISNILFTPDTPGESVQNYITFTSASNSSTTYNPSYGSFPLSATSWNTTETTFQRLKFPAAAEITSFYLRAHTNPGTSKNYNIMLRKNSTDTTASVTIANAATTGNITGISVPIAAGDYINARSVPTGTPTALIFAWGFALRFKDSNNSMALF